MDVIAMDTDVELPKRGREFTRNATVASLTLGAGARKCPAPAISAATTSAWA